MQYGGLCQSKALFKVTENRIIEKLSSISVNYVLIFLSIKPLNPTYWNLLLFLKANMDSSGTSNTKICVCECLFCFVEL